MRKVVSMTPSAPQVPALAHQPPLASPFLGAWQLWRSEIAQSRKLGFQRGGWMWMRSRAASLEGGRERGDDNLPTGWGCRQFASSCSKRKHV